MTRGGKRLQANTMLMYPLEEAVLLLSEKLSTARKNLNNIKEDLEFLREQVTVMEVNFARVHNVSAVRTDLVLEYLLTGFRIFPIVCSGTSSGKLAWKMDAV